MSAPPARSRWRALRWLAVPLLAACLLLVGTLLVLPLLASGPGARLASRWLERPLAVDRLSVDPLHLAVHLEGLRVGGWHATQTADEPELAVARADLVLATRSLWQGWPEIRSLHIQGPRLRIRRDAAGRLSVQDLLDRFLGHPTGGAPPALVLRDLVVADGQLDWQDARHGSHHRLAGVQLELPLLSTRAADAAQPVQPRLYGRLDQRLLVLYGSAQRREDGSQLALHFEVEDLRLPDYVDLLPVLPGLVPRDGRFDARMDAQVSLRHGGLPGVRLSGQLTLRALDLRTRTDARTPVLTLAELQLPVRLADLERRQLQLGRAQVRGFALAAARDRDGQVDWVDIARGLRRGPARDGAARGPAAVPPEGRSSRGGVAAWQVDAEGLDFQHGSFSWRDDLPPQPVRFAIPDAALTLGPLHWPGGPPVGFALSLRGDRGEGLYLGGLVDPRAPAVDAEARLAHIDADRFSPYFAGRLPVQVQAAPFDTRARIQAGLDPVGAPWARIEGLEFALASLSVLRAGQPLAEVRQLAVHGLMADSRDRAAQADAVEWQALEATAGGGHQADSGAVALKGIAADWQAGHYRLEGIEAHSLRLPGLVSAGILTGSALELDLAGGRAALGSLGAAGLDTPGGLHAEAIQLADASGDRASRRISAGQLNAAGLQAPGGNRIEGVSLRGGSADLRQGRFRLDALAATGIALGGRLQVSSVQASQADIDLAARHAHLALLAASGARLELLRTASGRLDTGTLAQALAALPTSGDPGAGHTTVAPGDMAGGAGTASGPWHAGVHELRLDDCSGHLRDASRSPAADLRWSALALHLSGVGTRLSRASGVTASVVLDQDTRLSLEGELALDPLQGRLQVGLTGLNVDDWLPWLPARLPLTPHGGSLDATGTLTLRGRLDAPAALWDGQASMSGVELLDPAGGQPLLGWNRLELAAVHLNTAPPDVALGEATLDGLRARLELLEDGSFNLSRALAGDRPQPAGVVAGPAAVAPQPGIRTRTLPATGAGPATPFPLAIGRITIRDGRASFTDRFVRPEYSAHLTSVQGSVSGLSSQSSSPGRLELAGQLDGGATVRVSGSVQPLRRPLALDLAAVVRGFELGPLSSYSTRFTGFPIVRGKLSFDVGYHLHDGSITATNQLTLDQLTLGPRQEVRGIRQLPMDLAVSLLKDSDGVINVDLPIQGTLADPQFNLGSIVGQLVTRAVERAVTAPFRWLGSLFGGEHAQDLGWIGFAPGSDALDATAVDKLGRLAAALRAKPGLRLDITAYGDPALDAQGLGNDVFHQKLLVQEIQRRIVAGIPVERPEEVTWDEAAQPALLAAAWRQEHPRAPMPADPQAMERDLRASVRSDAAELSGLATRRARAAQDWLTGSGGIDPARVFLVSAADPAASAGRDGASATGVAPPAARVEFSVR